MSSTDNAPRISERAKASRENVRYARACEVMHEALTARRVRVRAARLAGSHVKVYRSCGRNSSDPGVVRINTRARRTRRAS